MPTRYLIAPITHALHGCDVDDDKFPRQCDRPATWRVWSLTNIAPPGEPPDEGGRIFLVCDAHIHLYASSQEQERVRKDGPSPEWETARPIMIGDED